MLVSCSQIEYFQLIEQYQGKLEIHSTETIRKDNPVDRKYRVLRLRRTGETEVFLQVIRLDGITAYWRKE